MQDRYNVLFLGVGNSTRSIIAESILNRKGFSNFTAYSAGSTPTQAIHPAAVRQLEIAGLPTAGLRTKSWAEFAIPGAPHFDFVFTLCDGTADEVCPIWPGHPITGRWSVPDPTAADGSPEEMDHAFLDVFAILERRISLFLCLPRARLDDLAIKSETFQLGRPI